MLTSMMGAPPETAPSRADFDSDSTTPFPAGAGDAGHCGFGGAGMRRALHPYQGQEASMTLIALVLAVSGAAAPARIPADPRPGPRVEVAFVLDTTGSMGGLIEGAKRRIWSIARRIGEGRPRPDLRIALVGYRDLGDAYLTRVHDFTGDMDEVFANLSAFRAEGGGD